MIFIGMLLWTAIMLFIIMILIVFVPSLVIAIINLVQGVKRHWPKKNIILLSIFGSIAGIFIIAWFMAFLFAALEGGKDSSADEMLALNTLLIALAI